MFKKKKLYDALHGDVAELFWVKIELKKILVFFSVLQLFSYNI